MGKYVLKDNVYYWITDSGKKIPVDVKVPSTPMRHDFFRPFITRAMKLASSTLKPGNSLTKAAQTWKKKQAIVSLTYDELLKETKDKKVFVDQKVDGQTALMDYKDGKARFGSLGGRVHTNLPVLDEIEKILKRNKIKKALVVGELVGYANGKIIPFNESESLIKNPKADKEKVHWFPYQIINLDDEEFPEDDYDSYIKIRPKLDSMFRDAKYVHPTKHYDNIKEGWKNIVEKEGNEGIVVRSSDLTYKAKPVYTYDVVVIAVGDKKLKAWPKREIGNVLVAFMDKENIFREIGEVGTGWTDEQKKELYDWAQHNKVSEDERRVWVKPKRVIEVQWERSNIVNNPAYEYKKGKYEEVGKKPVGSMVKPRFIRYRKDKSVNPDDLRLTQIPNWNEGKKEASTAPIDFKDFVKYRNTLSKRYGGPSYRPPQAYKADYEEYVKGLQTGDEVALKIHENAQHLLKKASCQPLTFDEFICCHTNYINKEPHSDEYFPPQRAQMLYEEYKNILKKHKGPSFKKVLKIFNEKARHQNQSINCPPTVKKAEEKRADYPDHPDEVVISKAENILGNPEILELDVWSYYEGIKDKLIPQLRDKNLFIVVKPDGKPVYIRHPYDKKTEFIRINNEKNFETFHSGRTVEYHCTAYETVPFYMVDMDAPGTSPADFKKAKKVAGEIADRMKEIPEIKEIHVFYTGKRGFHIQGMLKKPKDIDSARKILQEWLKTTFGDREDLVVGESPKGNRIALGLAPMKVNGGHVALWSLRVSGLCCVEVPRKQLGSFDRESATPEKVHMKLMGRKLEPIKEEPKMKKSAQRVVKAFLEKESFVLTEPGIRRPLRQRERLRVPGPRIPGKEEFAKPGETVMVHEKGQWVKKPWRPEMQELVEKGEVKKV